MSSTKKFDEQHVLDELKHYLPTQAPLKDFIHHNTLHAYQHHKFHQGLAKASAVFGYKVYLLLDEYRKLYQDGKIGKKILERIIQESYPASETENIRFRLLEKKYETNIVQESGKLRQLWKSRRRMNLDKDVHPYLFRFIGNYLDQGISLDEFPVDSDGFLAAVRNLEKNSIGGIFKSKRVKKLLHAHLKTEDLLKILIGNEKYFERYLFEQQFAHPGWSGMVAVLEENPESLLKKKKISLHDFITFELLMEIEAVDLKNGESWKPLLEDNFAEYTADIFSVTAPADLYEVYSVWQEAFEWSFYDQALAGVQKQKLAEKTEKTFQAVFCIDDRSCSFRRYLEAEEKGCETFATAGFFNVEFYFQPEHGKFYAKSCPAPLAPQFLIKESAAKKRHQTDAHFSRHNQGFISGFLSASTLGILSGLQLAKNILYPTESPVIVAAKNHMDPNGKLSIENKSPEKTLHHLQIGFTEEEITSRMEVLLKSIGMVENFAPLVYIIGHGASSVNNTHYAGYDCGACSGRAGSVNARVAAWMLNQKNIRGKLAEKGISIPESTQFIGALHDTTRDEIFYYDLDVLEIGNVKNHIRNARTFEAVMHKNSKERARRFLLIDSADAAETVHGKVKLRSLSLFEPRPEWNHATNCLCIIGKRELTKNLFLDRRAFLQSYDHSLDHDGKLLLGIMRAIAPVCGGINLEYYFSRNDNYRLGAGTKLPHNVMGLIGVANGMDGDLRTGLPYQMINIHDPLRLLVIVAQYPEKMLQVLEMHPPTFEWFANNWIHLCIIRPDNNELYRFINGKFIPYKTISEIQKQHNPESMIEKHSDNLPIMELAR